MNFLLNLIRYAVIFYLPIISALGITGNILIIYRMRKSTVQIAKLARYYYIIIAIGDLCSLIFFPIHYFLYITYSHLTSQSILHILTPFSAKILCKLIISLHLLSYIVSQYTIMAYSTERNIALYFPLRHRKFNKGKLQLLLLMLYIGIPVLFLLPLSVVTTGHVGLSYSSVPACSPYSAHTFFPLFTLSAAFLCWFIPAIGTIVLVLALVIKMISIINSQARILQVSASLNSRERTTLITLVSVALTNICIFVPICFLSGFSLFMKYSEHSSSINTEIVDDIFHLTLFLGNIMHSMNFFVYPILIPSFR